MGHFRLENAVAGVLLGPAAGASQGERRPNYSPLLETVTAMSLSSIAIEVNLIQGHTSFKVRGGWGAPGYDLDMV